MHSAVEQVELRQLDKLGLDKDILLSKIGHLSFRVNKYKGNQTDHRLIKQTKTVGTLDSLIYLPTCLSDYNATKPGVTF